MENYNYNLLLVTLITQLFIQPIFTIDTTDSNNLIKTKIKCQPLATTYLLNSNIPKKMAQRLDMILTLVSPFSAVSVKSLKNS